MKNESTHEFVQKLHDQQEKQQKNKEKHGTNTPSKKLPNAQH
ncbi:DUF4023 domain-containing protein [Neobacillus fumarioli]|nr:DUF4023 domain-containing protein [Neobacillus fumarioli]